VGALDTYAVVGRCPACGDLHHLGGQTKAFDPDFGGLHARQFTPGKPQPLAYPPSEMLREGVWDDEWWRVRARAEPGKLAMLVDFDELLGCTCGRPLAVVLRFELDDAAPSLTLTGAELLDAIADDVAARVDLANAEQLVPWTGDYAAFRREVRALASAPADVRAARLRDALAHHFEDHERWLDPDDEELLGWTRLVGPVHCEACGATRDRAVTMSLTHPSYETSVLGEGWTGGVLRPGVRVAASMAWRHADEDRGYFVRLRHPLPENTLTLCGGPESWGCGCGAGRASVLVDLAVDEAGFTLDSMRLRALRRPSDLDDIDLAYAPWCSRGRLRELWPGWRPADRAEALACLRDRWGLAEQP
jgi:hypothetical protein